MSIVPQSSFEIHSKAEFEKKENLKNQIVANADSK